MRPRINAEFAAPPFLVWRQTDERDRSAKGFAVTHRTGSDTRGGCFRGLGHGRPGVRLEGRRSRRSGVSGRSCPSLRRDLVEQPLVRRASHPRLQRARPPGRRGDRTGGGGRGLIDRQRISRRASTARPFRHVGRCRRAVFRRVHRDQPCRRPGDIRCGSRPWARRAARSATQPPVDGRDVRPALRARQSRRGRAPDDHRRHVGKRSAIAAADDRRGDRRDIPAALDRRDSLSDSRCLPVPGLASGLDVVRVRRIVGRTATANK